jgi:hypothetical protein
LQMDERDADRLPPAMVHNPDYAPSGDALVEPVAAARGASRSMDATLTEGMDPDDDTFERERRTLRWRDVSFHIIRSRVQGRPNELLALSKSPQIRGGDSTFRMWVDPLLNLSIWTN